MPNIFDELNKLFTKEQQLAAAAHLRNLTIEKTKETGIDSEQVVEMKISPNLNKF